MAKIRAFIRGKPLKVGFQDEARFGRINDPSACWAPKGIRPMAKQQMVREYTYAYGMVCPKEGAFDGLILPSMNGGAMSVFLGEMSKRYPDHYLLMIMDGAPCHTSGELIVPENIELLFLPPYSPQLNPQENIWDEMRGKWFGNAVFDSMNCVEKRMIEALLALEKDTERIRSICGWEWIISSI